MKTHRRGFTLMELLIVICIIAILIALLFPAISAIFRSVAEYQCQRHLQQLATVMQSYAQQFDGAFPFVSTPTPSGNDWLYASSGGVYGSAPGGNLERGVLVNRKLIGNLDILYCPADESSGLVRTSASAIRGPSGKPPTSYVLNGSVTYGDQPFAKGTPIGFRDNQVHVRKWADFDPQDFMFIEQSSGDPNADPPEQPSLFNNAFMPHYKTISPTDYALTSRHRGGGFVACMDGHVEYFTSADFQTEMNKVFTTTPWFFSTGNRFNPN
jgi:prepilin-type N-terminal cleavage/methylation domain-containing protein